MLAPDLARVYEWIYGTDLVFRENCWKLCGDAHCCSFSRHKAKFRLLGRGASQELPLLPGEFDFLAARGWTAQFADFERRQVVYEFGDDAVCLDIVASRKRGCACDHDTRTVICRLYPLLPVFDIDGRLAGTEALGVYEELEQLDGLAAACQIGSLPFIQLNLFLDLCRRLASEPLLLFHLAAYRAAKRHVFDALAERKSVSGKSAFALFEGALLRQRLIDHARLKAELAQIKSAFDERYGPSFAQGLRALRSGSTVQ